MDPESGLLYLRARYYDPSTGQFMSRDPLIAVTGSAYGYIDGNPLNDSDPGGLCFFCLKTLKTVAKVVAVVGAVGRGHGLCDRNSRCLS